MTFLEVDFPSKVFVEIQVDVVDSTPDETAPLIQFDFIWGIGMNGLSDFELALSKKAQGESVNICIQPDTVYAVFERLTRLVLPICRSEDEVCITAKILKIENEEHRDVVKAMAGLLESGCGGGCGGDEGCGFH